MSILIIWLLVLIISLFVLIRAAGHFTDSAEAIGLFFKIPAFVVGATIVAIGTSLPELAASIFAVFKNSSEIVIGNIVGSNITNIFFVLGFAALFGKKIIKIKYKMKIHLFFLVGSAILLAITIWNGFFTLLEAFLFLALFLLYLTYILKSKQVIKTKPGEAEPRKAIWKDLIILLISALFIYIGAKYTVESIITLSSILNIGKAVIAASAVALGTSLPELVVSIVAAKKGKLEIAIGNILGSNIFNTLAIMGLAGLFGSIFIPQNIINFALPLMLLATFIYIVVVADRKITKIEGGFLLILYLLFLAKLFNLF